MYRLLVTVFTFCCTTADADELVKLFYTFSDNDGDSESYLEAIPEELQAEPVQGVDDVDWFVYQPDDNVYLDFSLCTNRRQYSHEACEPGMSEPEMYQVKAAVFPPNSIATIKVSYLLNTERHLNAGQSFIKKPSGPVDSQLPQLETLKLDQTQIIGSTTSDVDSKMNGFVVHASFAEMSMSEDYPASLTQADCFNITILNQISCNFDLGSALNVERLRIKLHFPVIESDISFKHQATFAIHTINPAPTCPTKNGCDGNSEI